MTGFSVLMSLYIKESPIFLNDCLNSLYAQTVQADEIVIVLDGPINQSLRNVLDKWHLKLPIKLLPLPENVGLGEALNYGLGKCSFPLIARMDTDDICVARRFELQLNEFSKNTELALLGGAIAEFDGDVSNVIGKRTVATDFNKIKYLAKFRNPFNHMTVMFKKDAVLNAGGYVHHHVMEDYNLWLRMLSRGNVVSNIPDILVNARAGMGMLSRRRGYSYIKSELQLAQLKYRLGIQKLPSVICIFILRSSPRMMPIFIFKKIYDILRSK
ncbi:glycosyltransferase [Citrobacter freundii]|nr:glycosyltransferase [Citrobacter freundii]